MVSTLEVFLSGSATTACFTSPILFALGALNSWHGGVEGDYAAVSTGLCVCVCAAGLFRKTLPQREYRRDRTVLAFVAAHPGTSSRSVATSIWVSERVVARNLDLLVEDGLLVLIGEGVTSAECSYGLAP
ncbi:hypothetical protein GCM10017688_02440 [Streptomyces ramulosus]